jgi:threonine aldolase
MMKSELKAFASDNYAGVHPEVMQALIEANHNHAPAYGNDTYTAHAKEIFKRHFGDQVEVLFVLAGTGANVLALDTIAQPFQSIICAESAHINVDECGAIEKITGSQLVTVATPDGKLTPELVRPYLRGFGVEHHSQPGVISISQTTEFGTVYTPDELSELSKLAHANGMLLHVDGARISNAVAALGCDFRTLITDTGVDVLSFGGTKNGMMYGEAVVFLDPKLATNAKFYRKQDGQMASKHRFIAAQFIAMLEGDLWLRCASQANAMAKRLEAAIQGAKDVQITQTVQANVVFARLPAARIQELHNQFVFYDWNELTHEVRWMTSFDTTAEEVDRFAAAICGQ